MSQMCIVIQASSQVFDTQMGSGAGGKGIETEVRVTQAEAQVVKGILQTVGGTLETF
jgi:hypothetical protein